MLLQQVWLLTVVLLTGALSGRAQNSKQPKKPLICYDGSNHHPQLLTADFPKGFGTCVPDGFYFNKSCAEYRERNWETEMGAARVIMFCGDCRNAENADMECRQCDTDLCNDQWVRELPNLSEMRHCYLSIEMLRTVFPEAVLCPRNQSCATSFKQGYYTMVGCESHCERLKWGHCEYCNTDLCNRHGDNYKIPENPRVTASDQAVCVDSPAVARPTAQVAVLAVVAALALQWLQQ